MADNRGKYTLDELLRAKRSEKPDPAFWAQFDRELKTKQKLLIQRKLASETRRHAPIATRFLKVGSVSVAFGAAALAVYLGFQTPVGDDVITNNTAEQTQRQPTPTFTVAKTDATGPSQPSPEIGLKEFSALARPSAPRLVVNQAPAPTAAPTKTQLKAIETLASLEETIRGKRANNRPSRAAYEFVSSSGLFDTDLVQLDQTQDEVVGVWDLESAYLLGKLADPLTGGLPSSQSNRSINDIQHVSFSQIDEALSGGQSRRSSNRSIDALSVRF